LKRIYLIAFLTSLIILSLLAIGVLNKHAVTGRYKFGDVVDSLNGVPVFYNGRVGNVSGRNTTKDGYNLGLKYQCVEFVKRYYYQHLKHKMPYSYGHAKEFFNHSVADGQLNKQRNLLQFSNSSGSKPQTDDLLVFDGTKYNKYGHVAIISSVTQNAITIIQQNPGRSASSRSTFSLSNRNGKWRINNQQILGWLRKASSSPAI
jgi:surface antigen